jgi:lipooligosaccharide transport system permease protein
MSSRTAVAPTSTSRACLLVVEGNWAWLRRNWRATLVSNLLQPVLFLIAIGIGFGALVTPSAVPSGTSYLAYLTPGLLALLCVQQAASEATYPLVSGFVWQQSFHRITSTPISPGQLLAGQLTWIALRLTATGLIFLGVATAFHAVDSPRVVLALAPAVLCGMAVAAPLAAFAASLSGAGTEFDLVFRAGLTFMTLFSGTFFGVDVLPAWLRPLAWLSPLWHGGELCRTATFAGPWGLAAAGHVLYLLSFLLLGGWAARRQFSRRLRP